MNLITHSQAREARAIASQTDPGPKDKRRLITIYYQVNGFGRAPFTYEKNFNVAYEAARYFFKKQIQDDARNIHP